MWCDVGVCQGQRKGAHTAREEAGGNGEGAAYVDSQRVIHKHNCTTRRVAKRSLRHMHGIEPFVADDWYESA